MLIYANAVTQIWKRLAPSVGSWTEARNSHVALRAWGNLQPTDSTCTFLLLMFTARSSLEITGIIFFVYVLLSLLVLFFFTMGEVNPVEFGIMNAEHNFGLSRDLPWLQNSIPGSPGECPSTFSCCCVFILFFSLTFLNFFAVSHCSLLKLEATVASYTTLIHSVM